MLKLPFSDDDDDITMPFTSSDGTKRRQERQHHQDPLFKGMKTFGARHSKDGDCMNQANFVALAMERKRRRNTEDFIHQAASRLTELFHPSPASSTSAKGTLSSAMDILELRQLHHDDTSSVTSSTSSDLYNSRTSEVDLKGYYGFSRESWQSFQDFSDVLKSEAMIRRMQQQRQQR